MENQHRSQLSQSIIKESHELQAEVIKLRRNFHQHPETMYEEFNTSQIIHDFLLPLGYSLDKVAGTGWIATLEGDHPGKTIALRADMDALNVEELNDVPYKSQNPHKMHACGHDAHMACLLGAAKILASHRNEIHGTIKLIFQPAEEGGGGAKKIIDEGYFEDIDKVFGLHVWSPLESGILGSIAGNLMAASDQFEVLIKGKGGHAAMPHLSIDPTLVVGEIFDAFQKLITKEINPLHTALINTPEFFGSEAYNVIPTEAKIRGTLRTFEEQDRTHLITRMKEIVEHYGKAWRCDATITFAEIAYPTLKNHGPTLNKIKGILSDVGKIIDVEPTLGGEDFAFYLQKSEGVFLFLGIRREDKDIIYPHHHAKFQVDEDVLWKGVAVYSLLGMYELFAQTEDFSK